MSSAYGTSIKVFIFVPFALIMLLGVIAMKKFDIEREEYINKTFKIPVKLVDRMNIICDKKNVSLNKLVVKSIEYALDNSEMEE